MFPETLCPVCRGGVPNKAIWLVTDAARTASLGGIPRLLGQAIPRNGERLVLERPNHPHADQSGELCFGNVSYRNIVQALFLAINPRSPINPPGPWFRAFCDHDMAACRRAGLVVRPNEHNGSRFARTEMCPGCGHRVSGCVRGSCDVCWPPDSNGNATCIGCNQPVMECPCGCYCIPAIGPCNCGCELCRCVRRPIAEAVIQEANIDDQHNYCEDCEGCVECGGCECGF